MSAAVLAAATAAGGILAGAGVFATPARSRAFAAGALTAVLGAFGIVLGASVIGSELAPVRVAGLIPLAGVTIAGDATSGFFVIIVGAVAAVVGGYSVGYFRHSPPGRSTLATLPVFVTAMLLLPLAASVTTFLALWELMALTSLVLVLAEHHRAETRQAALVYAVMTELGFLSILVALVWFAGGVGSESFAAMGQGATTLSSGTRNGIFLLTLIGFGSKAGLLPLHGWLPRAHPAAPSPVSALLSAAMVNLGVYGMIRFNVILLGPGPRWWGLIVVLVGALTAVYAVLQASVANDLKRLLAFSTSENMGLVTVGLGAMLLLSVTHNQAAGVVAMVAALLQLLAHAAFKTLGFLSAGAVVAATGHRDLDRLGGLASRMPATTVLFGLAALGASGLPFGAAFVSEWSLVQGLIGARPGGDAMVALTMPLAVAAVALTAGLGVAAMVKAFGIGFLARARSDGAARARESSGGMLASQAAAAAACCALAVAPSLVSGLVTRVLRSLPATAGQPLPHLGLLLRLPGTTGSLSPVILAALFTSTLLLIVAGLFVRTRRTRRPSVAGQGRAALWGCGGPALTPRMQYTSSAFAEPLQRVFDDVLRPDIDVDVSHLRESRYLVAKVRYRAVIVDVFERRLYRPVVRGVEAVADIIRRGHTGNVHAYLAYGAVGLLVVLLAAR